MPTIVWQPDSTTGKDTYSYELYRYSNFVNEHYVYAGKTIENYFMNAFLQFDLSAINGKVTNAVFDFTVTSIDNSISKFYNIHPVTSSWDDATLTYNNQPSINTASKVNFEVRYQGDYSVNITDLINAMVQGNNYGFRISTSQPLSDATDIAIASSEYTLDPTKRPKLTITYNESPGEPDIISPNGRESWTGNQSVEISAASDLEGDSLQYEYQLSTDNGETWNTIQPLTNATIFTCDFSNEQQTSLALVRARAFDGLSYSYWSQSDGVFTIQHNSPPTPPSNLSPSGSAIDRSIVQRLSWTYNDPDSNDTQSKAVIEWRLQGIATWNVINNNSNRTYFDVSSSVFPVGQIEWRVKTYDQTGAESSFSQIAVFTSADPTDAPTIISPSSTVNVSSPVVQWTVLEQTTYQVVVEDTIGTVIWDTGEVVSTNKARTIGASLINGGQYVIKVRVKNNASLWTDYALLNITVSYTPPAKPTINVSSATGHIVIEINNPSPTGTQPDITGNEVYKRINDEWVKIAEGVNFVTYRDYAVASGVEYNYKVRVIGDNGTFSESNVDFKTIAFRGVWLHTINNAEVTAYNFKFDGGGRESSWEVESSLMRFKGRTRPVIETGEMKDDLIDFNLTLTDRESKEALERIVKSQEIVCYRDGRGRIRFGVFTRMPLSDENWGGYTTSLQLIYIDYSEGI
jgi:hypothetical protein